MVLERDEAGERLARIEKLLEDLRKNAAEISVELRVRAEQLHENAVTPYQSAPAPQDRLTARRSRAGQPGQNQAPRPRSKPHRPD
jgi:hypothetical protein